MDEKFVPFYAYISNRPPNKKDRDLDKSLKEYMEKEMPLESEEGMEKRREVLVAVEGIFIKFVKHVAMKICHMSEEEADDAGGELRVSGSHRLGVRDQGADIDTICVAPNFVTREHFFDILKKELMNHPDVSDFSSIETAVVPIMAFDFQDISIDLLFARLSSNKVSKNFDILTDDILTGIDEATEKSLNGPRVTDMIPKLACKAKDANGGIIEHEAFADRDAKGKIKDNTFLIVLRCVRRWAKKRGLYGNKMGYLGGVNCNLLVAMVCQLFPNASASTLLVLFFRTYAGWAWPKPVQLNKIQPNPSDASYDNQREIWNGTERWYDLMPIITPAYPAMNSSMSVSVHSRDVMKTEFAAAFDKCKNMTAALEKEGFSAWGGLFEPSDFFIRYSHYLQVNIVGTGDDPISRSWMGYCESRVRGFPQYLEGLPLQRPIHLYPVQSKTDKSANSVCYFIGFDVDQARFNPDKPLHVDTCAYNFHKMLTEKYKGTMQDGLDFYVDHYPWRRLPKELFESYGGRDAAKEARKSRGFGKYGREKEKEKEKEGADEAGGGSAEDKQNDGTKGEGEGEGEGEGKTSEEDTGAGTGIDADADAGLGEGGGVDEVILQSRKRSFAHSYSRQNGTSLRLLAVGGEGCLPDPITTTITTTTTVGDMASVAKGVATAAAEAEAEAGLGRKRTRTGAGKATKKRVDAGEKEDEEEVEEGAPEASDAQDSGDSMHLLSRSRDVHWQMLPA